MFTVDLNKWFTKHLHLSRNTLSTVLLLISLILLFLNGSPIQIHLLFFNKCIWHRAVCWIAHCRMDFLECSALFVHLRQLTAAQTFLNCTPFYALKLHITARMFIYTVIHTCNEIVHCRTGALECSVLHMHFNSPLSHGCPIMQCSTHILKQCTVARIPQIRIQCSTHTLNLSIVARMSQNIVILTYTQTIHCRTDVLDQNVVFHIYTETVNCYAWRALYIFLDYQPFPYFRTKQFFGQMILQNGTIDSHFLI